MVVESFFTKVYVSWQDENRRHDLWFLSHKSGTVKELKEFYAPDITEVNKVLVYNKAVKLDDEVELYEGKLYRIWWYFNAPSNS